MAEEEKAVLNQLEKEFIELKAYLKTNRIEGSEYDRIIGPLADTVQELELEAKLSRVVKLCIRVTLAVLVLFLLFQVTWFQNMISVLFRVLLLKILPWWDWTRLYYSDCILTNPFYQRSSLSEEDCKLCETSTRLQRLSDASPKIIWEDFLMIDRPFIIDDGMTDWAVMKTNNFWFDNITELYLSKDLVDLEPCEFGTNINIPSNNLSRFLREIHDPKVKNWFGHWENCDKRAAKALRSFYRRPYFIPSTVDLSESNWVILSSNYTNYPNYITKTYNQLDSATEMLMVAQIRGWTRFRLLPRKPCISTCLPFVGTIEEGQMVVLTSFMWEFEYVPGEKTDNLAIAVGGYWN